MKDVNICGIKTLTAGAFIGGLIGPLGAALVVLELSMFSGAILGIYVMDKLIQKQLPPTDCIRLTLTAAGQAFGAFVASVGSAIGGTMGEGFSKAGEGIEATASRVSREASIVRELIGDQLGQEVGAAMGRIVMKRIATGRRPTEAEYVLAGVAVLGVLGLVVGVAAALGASILGPLGAGAVTFLTLTLGRDKLAKIPQSKYVQKMALGLGEPAIGFY